MSMKKIFLTLIVCVLVAGATQAQYKPGASAIVTEVNFTPFGNLINPNNDAILDMLIENGIDPSQISVSDALSPVIGLNGGAKVRYFLSDNMAIRVNLGYSSRAAKAVEYGYDGEDKEYETTKMSVGQFSIMPGIESHFAGTERLSPYVGAELGIKMGSTKTNVNNSKDDDYTKAKSTSFGFGLNAFAGMDYYVAKNIYLGAEFGLGFTSRKVKAGTNEMKVGGVKTSVESDDYNSFSRVSFNTNPAIRFGWVF